MTRPTASRAPRLRAPAAPKWQTRFLAALAESSNVSAAARTASISTAKAYEARRADADFHRRWQQALCEGYDHLEMELLQRLRTGEVKPATGARRGVRAYDNATAFRLLAAHRESAARQRAIRDNEDSETILAELDAKLELMRQRWLSANGQGGDGQKPEA